MALVHFALYAYAFVMALRWKHHSPISPLTCLPRHTPCHLNNSYHKIKAPGLKLTLWETLHAYMLCIVNSMGCSCIVCGRKKSSPNKHQFPKKHTLWLSGLSLAKKDVTEHSKVCSMYFHDGNSSNLPSLSESNTNTETIQVSL